MGQVVEAKNVPLVVIIIIIHHAFFIRTTYICTLPAVAKRVNDPLAQDMKAFGTDKLYKESEE